jgi:allantoinase
MDKRADLVLSGRISIGGQWRHGEVAITGERIDHVVAGRTEILANRRIDVGEALLLPGMIDAHVHSRSHLAEGITAATRAAAAGGVTTIVEMPFDGDGPIDSVERFEAKRELVAAEAVVDVALLGTVAPGGGWSRAADIAAAGACGFKISLFDTDRRRFPRISDAELIDALTAIADTRRTVCVHAENNEMVKALIARYRDEAPRDPLAHCRSRPPASESMAVLTALEAASYAGAQLHLCHLSLPRSVDLVRWYAQDGLDVTLETCPHYLLLDEADMVELGSRVKINPPLRAKTAREGLWERLADGSVDVVSSDHAPWPVQLKSHETIFDNHSGAPGVETGLPLTLGAAWADGAESVAQVIDAMSRRPAERFGLGERKGQLAAGFDADVVVFDPDRRWRVAAAELRSNAGWSPYEGRSVTGRVTTTLVRGRVVYDGTDVVGEPGGGRFVSPTRG